MIAYRVESTVFTSTTLLPFLIVTFDWPLENDPPATLIWIFAADKELRTNTGEAAGKVAPRRTSSALPLVEILAPTYVPYRVVVEVVLVLVVLVPVVLVPVVLVPVVLVDDVVSLEAVVELPNGSLLWKRLNPLSCPALG